MDTSPLLASLQHVPQAWRRRNAQRIGHGASGTEGHRDLSLDFPDCLYGNARHSSKLSPAHSPLFAQTPNLLTIHHHVHTCLLIVRIVQTFGIIALMVP